MVIKTIGTFFIVIMCILMFPIGIGILGGIFGIVIGVIGAVFGVFAGLIGAIFGGFFKLFGWMFDSHWPFGFFHCNMFTLAAVVLIIALIIRPKSKS